MKLLDEVETKPLGHPADDMSAGSGGDDALGKAAAERRLRLNASMGVSGDQASMMSKREEYNNWWRRKSKELAVSDLPRGAEQPGGTNAAAPVTPTEKDPGTGEVLNALATMREEFAEKTKKQEEQISALLEKQRILQVGGWVGRWGGL